MKTKSIVPLLTIVFAVLLIHAAHARAVDPMVVPPSPPQIQIALLLDTSNSMDGLIEQAKSRLWSIVNTFSNAKYKGQEPILAVALYEYGKSTLSPREGFTRMLSPFTSDLDAISEQLFTLRTNGGQEYCGHVIRQSILELDWSPESHHLKAIFIAGNEPFDQGKTHYRTACQLARRQGVTVSTLFCGQHQQGIATYWQDGAIVGNGTYMNIDQHKQIVEIRSPYDDRIMQLNRELNATYIGYGEQGAIGKQRQLEQDSNASSLSVSSLLQRSKTKSSRHYSNHDWDLVDAHADGTVDLEAIDEPELPDAMQAMSTEARTAYVDEMLTKRSALQTEIRELTAKRDTFVAEQRKQATDAGSQQDLEEAIKESLKKQAAALQYSL